MAGLNKAYKRRPSMVAMNGGPVLCLDAGSKLSYPGTGTTWTDLSGNGNNGTLTNGPTFDSANGGSFSFNGTTQYASTPLSLGGSTAFTIAAWIKTTVGGKDIIATYGVTNIFEFWLSTSKNAALYVYNTGTTYRLSAALVATGSWVYCVGVYNGATPTLSMYVNGALSTESKLGVSHA